LVLAAFKVLYRSYKAFKLSMTPEYCCALDIDAVQRGNSVYFPRRVVPMLPEELSNISNINTPYFVLCAYCCWQLLSLG
jgi:hypothetical protein